MRLLGAAVIIIIAVLIYIIAVKIIYWMEDFSRDSDKKWFGVELEDYKNNRQCAIASVTIFFVVITIVLLYLYFARW